MKNYIFKSKLSLALFSLLFFFITNTHAEILAPFGFTWGMSKETIISKGVVFKECKSDRSLDICQTKKSIRSVSFGDTYILFIDSKTGLQKIVMASKNITNDIRGTSGKELYFKVKKSLIKKYGEPKNYEYIGKKLYKEDDEFYQCLKYSGCGSWTSFWIKPKKGTVVAELLGLTRGKGYLKLGYESKSWSDILTSLKSQESDNDDAAL
jgi:hypothetical protein